jgi:hypothetical protein
VNKQRPQWIKWNQQTQRLHLLREQPLPSKVLRLVRRGLVRRVVLELQGRVLKALRDQAALRFSLSTSS